MLSFLSKNVLLNTFLRLFGISVKAFSILWLANIVEENVFKEYGILSGAIPFMVILLGFDIYIFFQRDSEYLSPSKGMISKQFSFYITVYLIVLIVGFALAVMLKNSIVFFIIILGILDHYFHETFRLANFQGRYLLASVMHVIKSTFWILTLLLLWFFGEMRITMNVIVVLYFIFTLLSTFILQYFLRLVLDIRLYTFQKIWGQIKSAQILFFNALIWRTLLSYDRIYVSSHFNSLAAEYIVSSQIALLIFVLFDASFVSIAYPGLVKNFNKSSYRSYVIKALGVLSLLLVIFASIFPIIKYLRIDINYFDDYLLYLLILFFYVLISLNTLVDTGLILQFSERLLFKRNLILFFVIVGLMYLVDVNLFSRLIIVIGLLFLWILIKLKESVRIL